MSEQPLSTNPEGVIMDMETTYLLMSVYNLKVIRGNLLTLTRLDGWYTDDQLTDLQIAIQRLDGAIQNIQICLDEQQAKGDRDE